MSQTLPQPAAAAALSEHEAKALLAERGLCVPPGRLTESAAEAVAAAEQLGYPVALKIASPDVLHKSDVGGVRLGLRGPEAVAQAYQAVLAAARAAVPQARLGRVLVERMAAPGQEVIVGLIRDPLFGPVVMFGLGGVFVEVLRDVSFRVAPIDAAEARAMIDELRGAPILHGRRGQPPIDFDALVEVLLAVAGPTGLALTHPQPIAELDLNPVLVGPDGATVVDARIVLGPAESSTPAPRAESLSPSPQLLETMRAVFRPSSVAVVGASPEQGKLGYRAVANLIEFGYSGRIYPIHPRAAEVAGVPAYPSLAAVPDGVERAIICVPAEAVPGVVDQCVAKGVRVAQIYTAGFGEHSAAGRAVEQDLLARARRGGTRLIGPNCIGTYCPAGGLAPLPGTAREPGPVACVSMSGGLTYDIIRRGRVQGLRFSQAISIGNAIDLDPTDFLEYFAADPGTRMVVMYVETVRDGRRFFELLRRTTPSKPVVILKGGQTERGGAAAASHTGALAGDFAVWSATCRQAGAVQVGTLAELLDVALAFQLLPLPGGPGLALVGPGGGASVTATDAAVRAGLELPPFAPETAAGLRALGLPPGTSLVNPLDAPAGVLRVEQGRVLSRILDLAGQDPNVDTLVVHLNLVPILALNPLEITRGYVANMVDGVLALKARSSRPLALVLRSSGDPEQEQVVWHERDRALAAGIPVYPDLESAIVAVGRLWEYAQRRR